MKIVIVGGGAAGVFAASAAKSANPQADVILIEKSAKLLSKVRISGGGRCNVTHHCFDPKELIKNYPRGFKELLGPFYRFQPQDTIEWFEKRGVALKTEADGRIFPVSDQSQEIIDCLVSELNETGVEVRMRTRIDQIEKKDRNFILTGNDSCKADKLLLATGSSDAGYAWARLLGHSIRQPVPSLFTFNIAHFPLARFSGIALEAEVSILGSPFSQRGPLLLTHWGFSGPAVLKLSAWGARFLHKLDYKFNVRINWTGDQKQEALSQELEDKRKKTPNLTLFNKPMFHIPKQLWNDFLQRAGIASGQRMGEVSNKTYLQLSNLLVKDEYAVEGKITHKAEFVTCGGVSLPEVNFKTMESRCCPGLFFAGEILDIDGITGGFNFQNAWTTGFIAGNSIHYKI